MCVLKLNNGVSSEILNIYTDHYNIFNNTGKTVKYITVVKNVRYLNIHNWTTFNNQPQGKIISIANYGDRFVKILSVQHYVKRKRFEIASASYSTDSAGSSISVCLSVFDCECVHVFVPVCTSTSWQGRQGRRAKSMLACIPRNATGCSTKSWYSWNTAFSILCIRT